jgi:hypothetical protein
MPIIIWELKKVNKVNKVNKKSSWIVIKRKRLEWEIETLDKLTKKSYSTLKKKYIKVIGWYISKEVWVKILEDLLKDFRMVDKIKYTIMSWWIEDKKIDKDLLLELLLDHISNKDLIKILTN